MNKEDKRNSKNSNDDIKTSKTGFITNVKLIDNLIERRS